MECRWSVVQLYAVFCSSAEHALNAVTQSMIMTLGARDNTTEPSWRSVARLAPALDAVIRPMFMPLETPWPICSLSTST